MTTTSRPIRDALSTIPGYDQAAATWHTLDTWPLPVAPEADLRGYVLAAAAAGEPTPPGDLAERVARQQLAERSASDALALARSVRDEAHARLDKIIRRGADTALTYLAGRLAEVLTTVRQADKALPARIDAEHATRAGGKTLAAWQQLGEAVDDYDAIRTAQWDAVRRLARPEGVGDARQHRDWFLRSGLLADALDRDAWWLDRRAATAGARLVTDSEGDQTRQTTGEREARIIGRPTDPDTTAADWIDAPDLRTPEGLAKAQAQHRAWLLAARPSRWPSTAAASSWWPTADRVGYLRWAVTHTRPWVPTRTALTEADTAALAATAPIANLGATTRSPGPATRYAAANDALAAYRRVTTANTQRKAA